MNFKEVRNQAMLLCCGIQEGIIDYKKLIGWIDQIISRSENPEDWMIEISLSKQEELDKVEKLLGKQFGYLFDGSLTEFIALIAFKVELTKINPFDCYSFLTVEKDIIKIQQNDTDSLAAKQLLQDIENHVEANHFDDESINNASVKIKELLAHSMEKHPEIIKFLQKYSLVQLNSNA